jgi:hypothetical protein
MVQIIITAAYALAFYLSLFPKIRDKQKREAWITGVMLAASYVIVLISSLDTQIPSPVESYNHLIEKIFNLN